MASNENEIIMAIMAKVNKMAWQYQKAMWQ
jgi:hypothetical protein